MFDCDLFVIGGGSGGVRAARIAAANHGASVKIADEYRYGGTCVIRGCVPKKLLVYGSHYRRDFADAAGFGWTVGDPSFDWATMIANKDAEIERLSSIYEQMLERAGVEVLHGRARVTGPNQVEIDGRTISARYILIATGGQPWKPDLPGCELAISSNEAFHLPALPQRIAVVGGGYIAVEFAHIFAGFGARTSLIHRRDHVLRGFDADLRVEVTDNLAAAGVDLHLNKTVESIETVDGARRLTLNDGSRLDVDVVMSALGRRPNTAGMGLEEAGVTLGKSGAVVVDDHSKTSVDSIYAVGDCTDRVQLTPIAIREGQAVADTLFGDRPTPIAYDNIPTAVFSQPAAAAVGLDEDLARLRLHDIRVYEARFRPMKHTLSKRRERMLIKLIVDGASDRIVGAHMVGDEAPEIIQCVAIAMTAGATKADFDRTFALHPSAAEELVLMRSPVR